MSRWEFMMQLEKLLSDIPPNEREAALQYYNDYFNDAGKENEKEVIESLGSPEQVAGIVRDGLNENESQGEFTENGFTSGDSHPQNVIIKKTAESGTDTGSRRTENEGSGQSNGAKERGNEKGGMPTWAVVLIVLGCVFLSPGILGLAVSALGVIVSVFTALIAVILGMGIAMVILYIVAVALVIAGFGTIIPHPFAGIGLIGGGCICAALGILFMLLLVFLVGKCIPGICQGISYIFSKLFGKKGGAKA